MYCQQNYSLVSFKKVLDLFMDIFILICYYFLQKVLYVRYAFSEGAWARPDDHQCASMSQKALLIIDRHGICNLLNFIYVMCTMHLYQIPLQACMCYIEFVKMKDDTLYNLRIHGGVG